jgi:hypothetical protein
VSGQGTNSIVVNYGSGVVNGNVSVVAVNNCGSSLPRNSNVKLSACPPGFAGNTGNKAITSAIEGMDVNVYPNPAISNFNLKVITAENELIKVRVLDAQGRFVKMIRIAPNQQVILGAELKSGVYLLEISNGKQLKTQRIVKI